MALGRDRRMALGRDRRMALGRDRHRASLAGHRRALAYRRKREVGVVDCRRHGAGGVDQNRMSAPVDGRNCTVDQQGEASKAYPGATTCGGYSRKAPPKDSSRASTSVLLAHRQSNPRSADFSAKPESMNLRTGRNRDHFDVGRRVQRCLGSGRCGRRADR